MFSASGNVSLGENDSSRDPQPFVGNTSKGQFVLLSPSHPVQFILAFLLISSFTIFFIVSLFKKMQETEGQVMHCS